MPIRSFQTMLEIGSGPPTSTSSMTPAFYLDADSGIQYYRAPGTDWTVVDGLIDGYSATQWDSIGRRFANRQTTTVAVDKTLAITDCGIVQLVTVDGKIVTLPATHDGDVYTVENGAADGTVAVTISPGAVDKISGAGLTALDNKDLINTKATAKKGDRVVLVADGVDGYVVQEMIGTWAREA